MHLGRNELTQPANRLVWSFSCEAVSPICVSIWAYESVRQLSICSSGSLTARAALWIAVTSFDTKRVRIAVGTLTDLEFANGEVLPSEKVAIHLNSWQIGLQILVKYLSSCLAAILVEFEHYIHELCRFGLPHAKIPVNRRRWTKSMFKATRFTIIHFQMAEFPMQKLCRLTL